MAMIGWLVAFVVLVGIEAGTMALTTIWFAGGALIAFLAALTGFSIHVQLVVFLVVSFLLLIFTRPFAAKFINKGTIKTNVDGLVGRKARVMTEINNGAASGTAVINGQEWTARAVNDDLVISAGETVVVKEIRGVKLIVDQITEGK